MTSDLPLLVGEVRGELRAFRTEYDRQAETARGEFAALRNGLAELRADITEHKAEKAMRHRLGETVKWAAAILVALFAGHVGAGIH